MLAVYTCHAQKSTNRKSLNNEINKHINILITMYYHKNMQHSYNILNYILDTIKHRQQHSTVHYLLKKENVLCVKQNSASRGIIVT